MFPRDPWLPKWSALGSVVAAAVAVSILESDCEARDQEARAEG